MHGDTSFAGLMRGLIGRSRIDRVWGQSGHANSLDISALCRSLLSARGEASGIAIADRILTLLEAGDDARTLQFFGLLRDDYEADLDAIEAAVAAMREGGTHAHEALQKAAEPPRQELFRRLNSAPNGTGRLVQLRAKLLRALRDDASLAPIDFDLRHLLRSWFNRGFLVAAPIDWGTPADTLEKIIAHEAVHAIDSWDDLRRRLEPPDRRCYAFFHPAMPKEPLIFVEVALTKGLAGSIQAILDMDRKPIAAEDADTAIFYSISNCQSGLAGISFGAFLIKQVAADLATDFPGITKFATLSPIPGLARWLAPTLTGAPPDPDDGDLIQHAAAYLAQAKDAKGHPLDPVARFHLGNGAELHRINLCADLSPKGLGQSHGAMVNYLYELPQVEARHENFAARGEIAVSRQIRALLGRSMARDRAGNGGAAEQDAAGPGED